MSTAVWTNGLRVLNEKKSRQKYMYSVNIGVGQTREHNTCVEMILILWFFFFLPGPAFSKGWF